MSRTPLRLLVAAALAGLIVYVVVLLARPEGSSPAVDDLDGSTRSFPPEAAPSVLPRRVDGAEERDARPASSQTGEVVRRSSRSGRDTSRGPGVTESSPRSDASPGRRRLEDAVSAVNVEPSAEAELPVDAAAPKDAGSRVARRAQVARAARLSRGPFGKYNRKVNALAEKLAFEVDQRHFYNEVLLDYEFRFAELREILDADDPESRERFLEERAKLQAGLDTRFLEGLTEKQAVAYRALPEWLRRPDPSAVAGDAAPQSASE